MSGMSSRVRARRSELKTRIRALERLVVKLSSRIEYLKNRCAERAEQIRSDRAHQVLSEMARCGGRQHSPENAAALRRLEEELESLSDGATTQCLEEELGSLGDSSATLRGLEAELESLRDLLHVDTSFEIEERSPVPRELPRRAVTPKE